MSNLTYMNLFHGYTLFFFLLFLINIHIHVQKGATFIDFVPSFMPATIERGQASFENSFEEMVNVLQINEKKYVNALPIKMAHMIGEDADAFALEQVDGKFFVLVSHGGVHR